MSNAEKIRLITCAMGPSSDWHRDPERFERVINLSKKLGMYKVSDTKQNQLRTFRKWVLKECKK